MMRAVLLSLVAAGAATAADFDAVVLPFVKGHCVACHGPAKKEAGLNLLALKPDAKQWRAVAARIHAGEMPPPKERRPDPAAVKAVLSHFAFVPTAEAGAGPQHGNLVPHELLFDPKNVPPYDAPPRVWRISPTIYAAWVGDMKVRPGELPAPFAVPPGAGFKSYAADSAIDEPSSALLISNAQAIVAALTKYTVVDGKVKGQGPKEILALFDPAAEPTRDQAERAIQAQFQIALRRPATPEESKRLVELMARNVAAAGRDEGVRATLAAILLSPGIYFRSERGGGPIDARGRQMLTPRELAFAVSYALTDRRPDQQLFDAAAKGRLQTADDVLAQVNRLLDDPKLDKTRVPRFFREYFGYQAAADVFKDQKENPDHDARLLVADTDRLVAAILAEDKDVLSELLTTPKSFVAYETDNKTKAPKQAGGKKNIPAAYGVNEWSATQPMTLDAAKRAGILTQPSWLVAHSLNAENHAILRGKWVRERLLGGHIPDLPITVDAQLPQDPKMTLRQKMAVTREAYCWNCHRKMNDLGLPFESFDHFGRARAAELGRPVDATSAVTLTGDPAVDGDVADAVAMIRKLAKTDRVRQVFVRHAFRYWMGRNETPGDAASLQAADRAYVESGGSMTALLRALLTSEAFLYRVPKPPAPTP